MPAVPVEQDPGALGFDAARLGRLDTHLGRYVDDGRLAGWQVVVSRHGQVVHSAVGGQRDKEAGLPVEQDTLWRLHSMTKPITSVVAMSLFEEGAFSLNDPVSRWLPEFADMQVFIGGSAAAPQTRPAAEPVRVWHLLTHTAGLTYGFLHSGPVDEIYRDAGSEFQPPTDLAGASELWASLPLAFEPGTSWGYSVATDVLGRLVEVLTGQSLDKAVLDRVLGPLGMDDTCWWVEPERAGRLAAMYVPGAGQVATRFDAMGAGALRSPRMLSGGGGLVGSAHDYTRFTRMLVQGGELDGTRVLGPRTLAYMGRNHLPEGKPITAFGTGLFAGAGYDGYGFGLGFAVQQDPVAMKVPASRGEMTWDGLASTSFWVDPSTGVSVSFFTQLMPLGTHPLRQELRTLVSSALVQA